VKILPSNQALILAGESAGRRAGGDGLLEQASRLVTGNNDLKRVTILSARADSTVVVQADYFSAHDGYATQNASQSALTVVNAAPPTRGESASTSFSLKPAQLYARTQRGFEDRKTAVLDVLA
jgi:hypothetical protein